MNTQPAMTETMASPVQPAALPMTSRASVNDARWGGVPAVLRAAVARVQHWMRSLGPYVAIELLLPGGTLIALALWTYRRWHAGGRKPGTSIEAARADVTPAPPRECLAPCGSR